MQVLPADVASITYPQVDYCITESNPSPIISGLTGGVFTIDNSGIIDSNTGVVDLQLSGLGNFTITYSTLGVCPTISSFSLQVLPADIASITYPQANYCITESNPLPIITGSQGGVFFNR